MNKAGKSSAPKSPLPDPRPTKRQRTSTNQLQNQRHQISRSLHQVSKHKLDPASVATIDGLLHQPFVEEHMVLIQQLLRTAYSVELYYDDVDKERRGGVQSRQQLATMLKEKMSSGQLLFHEAVAEALTDRVLGYFCPNDSLLALVAKWKMADFNLLLETYPWPLEGGIELGSGLAFNSLNELRGRIKLGYLFERITDDTNLDILRTVVTRHDRGRFHLTIVILVKMSPRIRRKVLAIVGSDIHYVRGYNEQFVRLLEMDGEDDDFQGKLPKRKNWSSWVNDIVSACGGRLHLLAVPGGGGGVYNIRRLFATPRRLADLVVSVGFKHVGSTGCAAVDVKVIDSDTARRINSADYSENVAVVYTPLRSNCFRDKHRHLTYSRLYRFPEGEFVLHSCHEHFPSFPPEAQLAIWAQEKNAHEKDGTEFNLIGLKFRRSLSSTEGIRDSDLIITSGLKHGLSANEKLIGCFSRSIPLMGENFQSLCQVLETFKEHSLLLRVHSEIASERLRRKFVVAGLGSRVRVMVTSSESSCIRMAAFCECCIDCGDASCVTTSLSAKKICLLMRSSVDYVRRNEVISCLNSVNKCLLAGKVIKVDSASQSGSNFLANLEDLLLRKLKFVPPLIRKEDGPKVDLLMGYLRDNLPPCEPAIPMGDLENLYEQMMEAMIDQIDVHCRYRHMPKNGADMVETADRKKERSEFTRKIVKEAKRIMGVSSTRRRAQGGSAHVNSSSAFSLLSDEDSSGRLDLTDHNDTRSRVEETPPDAPYCYAGVPATGSPSTPVAPDPGEMSILTAVETRSVLLPVWTLAGMNQLQRNSVLVDPRLRTHNGQSSFNIALFYCRCQEILKMMEKNVSSLPVGPSILFDFVCRLKESLCDGMALLRNDNLKAVFERHRMFDDQEIFKFIVECFDKGALTDTRQDLDSTWVSKSTAKKHMIESCPLCTSAERNITGKAYFSSHRKMYHTEQNVEHQCDHCGLYFHTQENLERHVEQHNFKRLVPNFMQASDEKELTSEEYNRYISTAATSSEERAFLSERAERVKRFFSSTMELGHIVEDVRKYLTDFDVKARTFMPGQRRLGLIWLAQIVTRVTSNMIQRNAPQVYSGTGLFALQFIGLLRSVAVSLPYPILLPFIEEYKQDLEPLFNVVKHDKAFGFDTVAQLTRFIGSYSLVNGQQLHYDESKFTLDKPVCNGGCPLCVKYGQKDGTIKTHLRQVHSTARKAYKVCEKCGHVALSDKELEEHAQTAHGTKNQVQWRESRQRRGDAANHWNELTLTSYHA